MKFLSNKGLLEPPPPTQMQNFFQTMRSEMHFDSMGSISFYLIKISYGIFMARFQIAIAIKNVTSDVQTSFCLIFFSFWS